MRSSPPHRHMEFHELIDAMRGTGCAICRLAAGARQRMLDALFCEQVNDARARERLRQAGGFCARHLGPVLHAGDPLGGSIVYADLLRHVVDSLGSRPSGTCPCCISEATCAANAVATLLRHIGEHDVQEAYEAGDGLCLPHLRQAMEQADSSASALLRRLELRKLTALAEECEELVSKADYRRMSEDPGPERDAWKRAARKLAGG
jgi:hypothetical protein